MESDIIPAEDKVSSLRNAHRVCRYEEFRIVERGDSLGLEFQYSISPDLRFTERLVVENVPATWKAIPEAALNNLVFHLGIAGVFSYWKLTAAPVISIDAGHLDENQTQWWKDLLVRGMGEYYYVNQIDFTAPDFVTITSSTKSDVLPPYENPFPERSLIPISGGRDSALTARAFQRMKKPFVSMLLNPTRAALDVSALVGVRIPAVIQRTLDPLLLELNRKGFLNGHVPFSAYLAFLSATCLLLYDCNAIVVANERSADEGNVMYRNWEINHQYSKSHMFEQSFNGYLRKYLLSQASYFSFVRELSQLQIARAFSEYSDLMKVFKSCNRNQKLDSWCGSCAKCLSVFMTCYPFTNHEELIAAFGSDYFENESLRPLLWELTSPDGEKPFECVCTKDEAIASLYLGIQECLRQGKSLPVLLQYAADMLLPSASECQAATGRVCDLE